MMAAQAKVTRFFPGASKRVTSESNSGLQAPAERDLKDVSSGGAHPCQLAGSVLQFAGLEVTLPSGVQAAHKGEQCLELRLSDGASITLQAGAARPIDSCAANAAAPAFRDVQQLRHPVGDAAAPPQCLACSEQLTNGTTDGASRCAPASSAHAASRQPVGVTAAHAPATDFRGCFARLAHTGSQLPAAAAVQAIPAAQPPAEQPPAAQPAANSFDMLLQHQSQRPPFSAAAPMFCPGRFLMSGEASGPPSGVLSGSAVPSATAEQSMTAEIDSPCAVASPVDQRAAVQSAAGTGTQIPHDIAAIAAVELQQAEDAGFASPAKRQPSGNLAAAPVAPAGPLPLQAAAATSPGVAQSLALPLDPAAAMQPPQVPQQPRHAAPGADSCPPQDAAGQHNEADAAQQHRMPLAAMQTPQGRAASPPEAAAGSGRKRKLATPASGGRPRVTRTRRSSAATPRALAAPEAADAGSWRASWQPVDIADTQRPAGRWGAALLATGASEVCLVGGAAQGGPVGDTWRLQLSASDCRSVSGAWQPGQTLESGRSWHTASCVQTSQGSGVLLFGGEVDSLLPEETDAVNDALLSAVSGGAWDSLPLSGEGEVPRRAGHSATRLPDGRILMFGGVDGGGRYRNDTFLVDASRCRWLALRGGITRGAPPKPRAYHSATLVGDRIIIVGGLGSCTWSCKEVYSLSIDGWVWREHTSTVDGDVPSPRYGHAAASLGNRHELVVYGGGDAEEGRFESDLAVLDTRTWRWSRPVIQESALPPPPRTGHCLAALPVAEGVPPRLLLAAGRCPNDVLRSDAWVLNLWQAGCS